MTDPVPDPARGAEVYAMDRAHVFHSWSAQGALTPLPVAGAAGSVFWDYDGRRYLDFSSQMVNTNIGHQHPRVTAAIAEQAARLATIAPQHASEPRSEAASRLAALAPDGMAKVFFTNGGADANENAIRMARLHTGRAKVLSFYRSYHGNTGAAISSTGTRGAGRTSSPPGTCISSGRTCTGRRSGRNLSSRRASARWRTWSR